MKNPLSLIDGPPADRAPLLFDAQPSMDVVTMKLDDLKPHRLQGVLFGLGNVGDPLFDDTCAQTTHGRLMPIVVATPDKGQKAVVVTGWYTVEAMRAMHRTETEVISVAFRSIAERDERFISFGGHRGLTWLIKARCADWLLVDETLCAKEEQRKAGGDRKSRDAVDKHAGITAASSVPRGQREAKVRVGARLVLGKNNVTPLLKLLAIVRNEAKSEQWDDLTQTPLGRKMNDPKTSLAALRREYLEQSTTSRTRRPSAPERESHEEAEDDAPEQIALATPPRLPKGRRGGAEFDEFADDALNAEMAEGDEDEADDEGDVTSPKARARLALVDEQTAELVEVREKIAPLIERYRAKRSRSSSMRKALKHFLETFDALGEDAAVLRESLDRDET